LVLDELERVSSTARILAGATFPLAIASTVEHEPGLSGPLDVSITELARRAGQLPAGRSRVGRTADRGGVIGEAAVVGEQGRLALVCRLATRRCALWLEHVVETMRPLPVEPLAGAPPFVRGVAVIRGDPVPVVDAASLLGAGESRPTRFVTVTAGDRRVGLAVDAVLGVQAIAPESLQELPPLLGDASAGVISAMGAFGSELVVVLRSARLVPEGVWALLGEGAVSR
jgi:purine-binding chemotaxis protein CheW